MRDEWLKRLNDPKQFSDDDLASIQTMLASPSYKKWLSLAQDMGFDTPEAKVKIVSGLYQRIDPKILAKLTVAASR